MSPSTLLAASILQMSKLSILLSVSEYRKIVSSRSMIPTHADLHTHTTCSDGTLPPEELIQKAHHRGLKVLAITDHDSIQGVQIGLETARSLDMMLIPGVELSVTFNGRELHLLGYGMDLADKGLTDYLTYFSLRREERARSIVDRLYALGLRLDYESLRASAPNAAIGRPHIARALVEAGYVRHTGEAFAQFLGEGRPANIAKELPKAQVAIKVINYAGGVSVLAHPGHWVSDREIYDLKHMGLDGIEIIHPSHDEMLTSFYTKVANKLNLLKAGGSDYHGKRPGDESNFGKTGLSHEQFERFRLAWSS